jgi:four helix bundle protein
MSSIESYRDLDVWKLGMQLAKECYVLTQKFPKEEMFGLTSQVRRASVSIPANIAEGYGRDNRGEYVQFLRIVQGSLKELETHLLISTDVNITMPKNSQPLLDLCDRIGKMLRSLIRKLQATK